MSFDYISIVGMLLLCAAVLIITAGHHVPKMAYLCSTCGEPTDNESLRCDECAA